MCFFFLNLPHLIFFSMSHYVFAVSYLYGVLGCSERHLLSSLVSSIIKLNNGFVMVGTAWPRLLCYVFGYKLLFFKTE